MSLHLLYKQGRSALPGLGIGSNAAIAVLVRVCVCMCAHHCVCVCFSIPPHSLHWLLMRWCWQMPAPRTPCICSSGAGTGRVRPPAQVSVFLFFLLFLNSANRPSVCTPKTAFKNNEGLEMCGLFLLKQTSSLWQGDSFKWTRSVVRAGCRVYPGAPDISPCACRAGHTPTARAAWRGQGLREPWGARNERGLPPWGARTTRCRRTSLRRALARRIRQTSRSGTQAANSATTGSVSTRSWRIRLI